MKLGTKQIEGLAPGWRWDYDPAPGFKGRHAVNIQTGEMLSVRQAQTKAHGGVRYEKRVPKEERKKYKRILGKHRRHGPFRSLQEIKDYKGISGDTSVFVQAYGEVSKKGKKSPGEGKQYRNVAGWTEKDDLDEMIEMQIEGLHETTPQMAALTWNMKENIEDFVSIDKFYLFESR